MTTPTHVRMLMDSREGNPTRGIPIATVVAAGEVLPCVRSFGPDELMPLGGYVVEFPGGGLRAVSAERATPC